MGSLTCNDYHYCSWGMALSGAGREAEKQILAANAVTQEGDDFGSDWSGGQRTKRGGKIQDIIYVRANNGLDIGLKARNQGHC